MDLSPEARALAPILVAVIVLWITEALPLAITALLGAVACVVAGVAPAKEVFRPFADPLIFLFIGAFLIAEAIRLHGLDRRLAYRVLSSPWIGDRPVRILAAIALVSVLISAFISNTVTTAMMMAITTGMLGAIEAASAGRSRRPSPGFATSLLLCVAFAASIGGLATPIGTPLEGVTEHVVRERAKLGRWTTGQKSVAAAFAITVLLWVLPGVLLAVLGRSHPLCDWLSRRLPEGVVALIGGILLFVFPGDRDADGRGRPALTWKEARIDWDIVLLYGGGLALGELCFTTGLAAEVGRAITGWIPPGDRSGPVLVAVAAIVAVVTSEFTSNTASVNMVVPVAIALAQAAGVEPLPAALAATFAASLGFMMPVSTPCNAMVYGSGRIPLRAMMGCGAIVDVAGGITVTLAMLLV